MKKGDVIRQKCVNTTFYLTGILAHKVNNIIILSIAKYINSCTFGQSYWYVSCFLTIVGMLIYP